MTPREVQQCILAEGDRRLYDIDTALAAAWHTAIWYHTSPKKIPDLDKVLMRKRRRPRPLTLEEEIRRWECFFASARPRKSEVN